MHPQQRKHGKFVSEGRNDRNRSQEDNDRRPFPRKGRRNYVPSDVSLLFCGAIGISAVLLLTLGRILLLEGESVPNAAAAAGLPGRQEVSGKFAIVTAFSADHLLEAVSMLKTLEEVRYDGPLYVYLMRGAGEQFEESGQIRQALESSFLAAEVMDYQVSEDFHTYCWKPKVIADFLAKTGSSDGRGSGLNVFMWADASTRFAENPRLWARSVLEDGVDFVGRLSIMGMGENTHVATYDYMGMSRNDLKNFTEIASGHFLVNLARKGGSVEHILHPWIDCASRACETCMAPIGSSKNLQGEVLGPPSVKYIGHRQDQSVLGLLTYDFMHRRGGNVQLPGKYMRISTRRAPDAHITSISSLNQNITEEDKAAARRQHLLARLGSGKKRLPTVSARSKGVASGTITN